MGDFFLKRFEIEGLNCCFSDIPVKANGDKQKQLSDVIFQLAETDNRFRFELESRSGRKPKISRLVWSNVNGGEFQARSDGYYELESAENGHTRTEFRYTISDQFGQLVETDFDAIRPIFSHEGPIVDTGYSIRIDLVAISLPHYDRSPLLARLAHRDVSWISDSDLILDLQ